MKINTLCGGGYDWLWTRMKVCDEERHLKNTSFLKVAESYHLTSKEKEAVDSFFLSHLGEKIPYLWHQYYTALSGSFDPLFFPNSLLIPYFEHYMNYKRHYGFVFEDKNVIPYVAKCAGVKMPRTVLSKTCGLLRDGDGMPVSMPQAHDILKHAGSVIFKLSTGACGGRGIFVKDFQDEEDTIDATLKSSDTDFVIQEVVKCHESISCMYPKSVNTFRVITYRWKDEIRQMPVFMRVGQGGAVVDNGAAGGMFLGVYSDGTLTDKAVMPSKTDIFLHPDTGFVFKGHRISQFKSVSNAAIRMHQMIPQIGIVYWDFTIDTKGDPVLIECNVFNGTIYAIQMTLGVPAFGEHTAEVLQWIRKMKHTPYSKRMEYAFGN